RRINVFFTTASLVPDSRSERLRSVASPTVRPRKSVRNMAWEPSMRALSSATFSTFSVLGMDRLFLVGRASCPPPGQGQAPAYLLAKRNASARRGRRREPHVPRQVPGTRDYASAPAVCGEERLPPGVGHS